MNADAILGYDGRFLKRAAWNLLKEGLVDVVASDAHSLAMRPPRMQECFTVLRKKLGEEQAEKLLLTNPKNILQEKR